MRIGNRKDGKLDRLAVRFDRKFTKYLSKPCGMTIIQMLFLLKLWIVMMVMANKLYYAMG